MLTLGSSIVNSCCWKLDKTEKTDPLRTGGRRVGHVVGRNTWLSALQAAAPKMRFPCSPVVTATHQPTRAQPLGFSVACGRRALLSSGDETCTATAPPETACEKGHSSLLQW